VYHGELIVVRASSGAGTPSAFMKAHDGDEKRRKKHLDRRVAKRHINIRRYENDKS